MSESIEASVSRHKMEADEKWRERRTPMISFPSTWKIELLMPFGKAVARFVAINDHGGKVSVYFDDCDALGVVGRPYWEFLAIGGVTVADDDDVHRFLAGEEDQLIAAIAKVGDPVRGAAIGLGVDPDEFDALGVVNETSGSADAV